MRKLYHYWICPISRRIRLLLSEKKLDYELVLEKTWEKRNSFLDISHTGEVPVFVDLNGKSIIDGYAIGEYIEETYQENNFIGTSAIHRAETRRLLQWFDYKFFYEVYKNLVFEKLLKRHFGLGTPDSVNLRLGGAMLRAHLKYMNWLLERRSWLCYEHYSLADMCAAAHISTVDYIGAIPWHEYMLVKEWYVRIKSRPSFQTLLQDRIPNIAPAAHYTDLDF